MRKLAAAALFLVSGCGPVTGSVPTASPTAMATSSPLATAGARQPGSLFAIAVGNQGCFRPSCVNQLAIVGMDGRVRARATFTPPQPALVGCEGGYATSSVQVAAGAVYYLDSKGLVRRLSPSGVITDVAHFPIHTSQQLMWLAVSPDGRKIMVAMMIYPPLSASYDPSKNCPTHDPGPVHEELDVAPAGGSTTTLTDQADPPHIVSLGGWDGTGPVAVPSTQIGYIGYIDGTIWAGPAYHLDARGRITGSPIGGADCQPLFGETRGGDLVCHDPKEPTVRDSTGQVLWKLKALDPKDNYSYGRVALSPDASQVAFRLNSQCCYTFDSSVIRSRAGVRIGLGSTFDPQGWLDKQTVIGARGSLQPTCSGCPPDFKPTTLSIINLARATDVTDLRISGDFLGVL